MKRIKAEVLSNKEVAPYRFKIRLEAPSVCRQARPGQFVMVKCSKGMTPFLRRPLSFHRIGKNAFELLYQIIGKGTEALSLRKKGEAVDIIGPLGNGFSAHRTPHTAHRAMLIAGGIGVAPLVALAEKLAHSVERIRYSVFIGAQTKSYILCEKEFKKLGAEVHIATEDGSRGHKGLITELLRKELSAKRYPLNAIYACGPRRMLKEIARIAGSIGTHCEISLEERMACGTGACLGCAVKTVVGYKMACKDGPIFNAGDIIW